MDFKKHLIAAAMLIMTTAACNTPPILPIGETPFSEVAIVATATQPATPTLEPSLTPSATFTPTATLTETPAPSPTPFGCAAEAPIDDYTRVEIYNGIVLNRRTITMLEYAQQLYGGEHDFLAALTQGSYNLGVEASFGTHDGGGAVDLSIRNLTNWHEILYDEVDIIIASLRQAGFAAYLRDTGSLYANSPVHIHAIAIGDDDLSEAAQIQLTGPEGYFRGYNALPENPLPDVHGGPILCQWMIDLGYSDLRE